MGILDNFEAYLESTHLLDVDQEADPELEEDTEQVTEEA